MKVIEKIISYEDYNYVEGTLCFKAYGNKTRDLLHAEYFSIDRISNVHLQVEKKYIAPELPPGINKNKVSTLTLPDKITTIIGGDYSKPYGIVYDEIIVDDSYVDEYQNIIGPRFNSTKIGSELSSTVTIKVYGLIKIKRQRTETENQFEIKLVSHGSGEIKGYPNKDSYATGEKVIVKAIPDEKSIFVGYRQTYESCQSEFELQIQEEDITIEADFVELKKAQALIRNDDDGTFSKNQIQKIKKEYDRIKAEEGKSYPKRLRDEWKHKSITNKPLGIEAHGFWEILSLVFSTLFYIAILILLIVVFGKSLLIFGAIIIFFWLFNLIAPYIFSWRGFQWILGFIFGLFILGGIINITENSFKNRRIGEVNTANQKIQTQKITNENTTIDYKHHVVWNDYDGNEYEIDLLINSDLVKNATNYKNTYRAINTETSYNKLLSDLYQKSIKDDFLKVKLKLDSIQQSKNLNKRQFSDVVVSMVQTIPYFAVVSESCNPYSYQDPAIRELLLNKPCDPFVRFGIKAPAEFLMDLKGDCDTRTLFLFGLLKSLGYDVAIFGSQKYKHSILGIVLNLDKPHYKIQDNKKYFLWEVTEKNHQPGLLPMQIANLDYWNINLN